MKNYPHHDEVDVLALPAIEHQLVEPYSFCNSAAQLSSPTLSATQLPSCRTLFLLQLSCQEQLVLVPVYPQGKELVLVVR